MLLSSVVVSLALTPWSEGSPSLGATPSVIVPTLQPEPSAAVAGIQAVRFGPPQSPSPAVHATQSRLWFHDSTWWAVLLDGATLTFRIFALDQAASMWVDTGVIVDDRPFARMDVLWDGESLVVASAGPDPEPRHALQVTRFSYDPAGRRFVRDPNFPVPITDAGVEAVTVARDMAGRLWVAYLSGGALFLDRSTDSDLAWRGPLVPTFAEGVVEQAAITAIGARVAVAWTRPGEDALRVATSSGENPTDGWEELPAAPVSYLGAGANEISLAVDNAPGAERLYVAVETGVAESASRGRLDPQVVVVEYAMGDDPTVYLVGRFQEQHVDPIVLVDAAVRELYVVAAAPRGGGSIYYKVADLDDIVFAPGLGTRLISASPVHPELAGPASTKQALDASSGLVVAATDSGMGVYGFGAMGLRPGPSAPRPDASAVGVDVLLDQTFDGLAVGSTVPGWSLEGDPPPELVVSVLQGVDSSARLSSTATEARACATYEAPPDRDLRLEAEIVYNLATGDDVLLLQARGSGGEYASLRLRGDELVYFDGAVRVRSGVTIEPGRWVRAMLTFDRTGGTYAISVSEVSTGEVTLEANGLGVRTAAGEIPNRLCVELPAQPGLDLYLDDVRVVAEP